MAENFEVTCPCCEALLVIDPASGNILLHKAKAVTARHNLEAMVSQLEASKSEVAKKFDKEIESQKDRGRILEAKFKEALARADKSDKRPINPMDLD